MEGVAADAYPGLRLIRHGRGVLEVALHRPERMNAVNLAFWTDFRRVFEQVAEDSSVRAIVVSGGASKHFTAGLDLMDAGIQTALGVRPADTARAAWSLRKLAKQWAQTFNVVEECPQPVIAVVHRACIGAGVDLIAACNVRICTEDAYFAIKEVDIAMAADVGALQRLPKLIGNSSVLHELALSGRKFDAQEAREIGLVGTLQPTLEAAREAALGLAKTIAEKSPIAIAGIKRFLHHARDHTVAETLEYAATWNGAMLQAGDMMTAQIAFMEKKVPVFEDLTQHVRDKEDKQRSKL